VSSHRLTRRACTAAGKSWYHGWHVLALLVYVFAGVVLPAWMLVGDCGDVGVNGELVPHNGLERLVVPVNVVLLLLNVESITNSLWLALFNWQMHAVALPIAALIKQAQMHAQAPQIVRACVRAFVARAVTRCRCHD
jgi:hypothetical protein